MVISFCESLRGFREHRGGDTPTDSRQGTKEVDVTMPDYLLVCTDLVQDRVNAAAQLLPQIVVEAQLGQEHEHVFAGRLRTASGQTERWCLQDLPRLYSVDSANAVGGQNSLDLRGG
jgi:hypothetical protein